MKLDLTCGTCGTVTRVESTEKCDCDSYQMGRTIRFGVMCAAIFLCSIIAGISTCGVSSEFAEVEKFRDAVEMGMEIDIREDGRAHTPDIVIEVKKPKEKKPE